MSRRRRAVVALLWGLVVVLTVTTAVLTGPQFGGNGSWGEWVLSFGILVVATVTLHLALPKPMELFVERQYELGYSDLIFYIYEEVGRRTPRDFLLQLHVAVANVGDQKGVLSTIRLKGFLDSSGATVHLPELPTEISGQLYQTRVVRQEIQGMYPDFQSLITSPPFMLDPGQVLTVRFRGRRGIDWNERWNLEKLRDLAKLLEKPLVKASIEATFRRANEVVVRPFTVDMKVEQQEEYRTVLRGLTQEFSVRPTVEERNVLE